LVNDFEGIPNAELFCMNTTNLGNYDTESLDTVNEEEFEDYLTDVLETHAEEHGVALNVCTFASAGLMTCNHGLVLRSGDMEFQITIVRSR
jgi:hypothetical protein